MTNQPQNLKELLDRRISGFHQYCLSAPYRPTYLSGNLCGMLGFSAEELLSDTEDRYAQQVHPADRQRYEAFLKQLTAEARTLTLEYRIRRKDGDAVYVSDIMTSYRCGAGMAGDSVLTDLSPRRRPLDFFGRMNRPIP